MDVATYLHGDTMRCYRDFITHLESSEPLGSESVTSSCFALCNSINNLFEILYKEKRTKVQERFSVTSKTAFFKALSAHIFDLGAQKADGFIFQLVVDAANAHKHMTLSRDERLIDDISQIYETILVICDEDEKGKYYAITKGIAAKMNGHIPLNFEIGIAFVLGVVGQLLIDFDIIDEAPKFREHYRNFKYTRKRADATFHRQTHMWVIRQYSKKEVPNPLWQTYQEGGLMNLRPTKKSDEINFKLEVSVEVVEDPMLKKPRYK